MRILAFDTATRATSVALLDAAAGLDLEARDDPPAGARPGHARRLLALIEELVAPAGGWIAVDRIAVGIGPGTFTGLRIGVATARGLARARGIPLVGVSTLAAIAADARVAFADAPLLAMIDARRGEAFAAGWLAGVDPVRAGPALAPRVLAPDALAAAVATLPPGVVATGDGAVEFRGVLEAAGVAVPADDSGLHRVSARQHCRLGAELEPGPPDAVLPAYLRLADAELARTERISY